jgi:hypothetical protein
MKKMTNRFGVTMTFAMFLLMAFLTTAFCDDSLVVDTNGNVGIGVTSPGKPLEIKEPNDNPSIRFRASNNLYTDIGGNAGPGNEFIVAPQGLEKFRIKTNGNVGIGVTNPEYKLQVNGSIYCNGSYQGSDSRWKTDITTLDKPLDKISALRGVTYQWNLKEKGDGIQIGLVAQEVEKVFPELVFTDKEGYKAVDYSRLVAPLIGAVKELKSENDTLKETLVKLEKRVAALENSK